MLSWMLQIFLELVPKRKTDLVTETDLLSEKVIKSTIRSEFDDHSIMAEESGKELTQSDYLWIIDPLDGTTNFVHGYPSYGISIGLLPKRKPLLGNCDGNAQC